MAAPGAPGRRGAGASHPVPHTPRWLRQRFNAPRDEDPAEEQSPVNWELIGQVVGVVAGLAAWIAVVGGARAWARLEAADIPALPTLAAMDRGWFLVEGLQTLVVPVLLGGLTSLLVYYSRPSGEPLAGKDQPRGDKPASQTGQEKKVAAGRQLRPMSNLRQMSRERPSYAGGVGVSVVVLLLVVTLVLADATWEILVLFAAFAALVLLTGSRLGRSSSSVSGSGHAGLVSLAAGVMLAVGFAWSLIHAVKLPALGVMVLATVVVVWITLGAVDMKRPGQAALTLFIAIVAWSGALGYAQEAGDRTPDLTPAVVRLGTGAELNGYYLGRSTDHVLVAQPLTFEQQASRSVVVLPLDSVSSITYGTEDPVPVPAQNGPRPPPTTPPTTAPTPPRLTLTPPTDPPDGESPATPGPPDGDAITPPVPFGPLDPQTPMTSENGVIGTVDAQLQILDLQHRENGYLELNARLVNLSDEPLPIGDTFGEAPGSASFDGVEVLDPGTGFRYGVAYTTQGCMCDKGLDEVVVPARQSRRLAAGFKVPESVSSTVDLRVPAFGWIRGIEIT